MQVIAGFRDFSVRVCPTLNTLCPIGAHVAQNGDDYRSPDLSHFVLLSFGMRFVNVVMRLSKSRNTDARKKNAPDLQEVGGISGAHVGCLAMAV